MEKKGEKKLWVLTILAAVLVVLLLVFVGNNRTNGKECFNNQDCVKQRITCCSCKMGGEEICMSKANATYWISKTVSECKADVMCIAQYNCKETKCLCKEGKCREE